MMYDIECPADIGPALDREERKLFAARRKRDATMTLIEAARHHGLKLSKDEYIGLKISHGNVEADAERARAHVRAYGRFYYGQLSAEWMWAQADMNVRKTSLEKVWQRWRDVLAARAALAEIKVPVELKDDIGQWPPDWRRHKLGNSRERIDALVAVERAEGIYDLVLRAFEGRQPRTHEQTLTLRVKPPTRKLHERLKKTPIKYVRDACGVRLPVMETTK